MSKIGIVTITILVNNENAYNYGNKLQMYAMQEYLRRQGHDCCTIRYRYTEPNWGSINKRSRVRKSIAQFFDDGVRIVLRKINHKRLFELREERKRKFDMFVENNIALTEEIYTADSNFEHLAQSYDCFIAGSDQIWNPYCEGSNEFYYLTFAPEEKRITFAPSIAVNNLPEICVDKYRNWIKGIQHLSIREDVGKKILEQLTDKKVHLVCDPVFLLSKDEWSRLANKPVTPTKYFVTYFLGKKTIEIKKKLKRLEKMTKLKCVDVYNRDSTDSQFCGPEEFLGFIKDAEFVCTDSFHGVAFSTIFHVPMVIFEREGGSRMNSRIESLLRVIECNNRSIDDVLAGKSLANVAQIDENGKLQKLVLESKNYLASALDKGEQQCQ